MVKQGRTEREDNFGYWDILDTDELAFFNHVRNASKLTKCKRCKSRVHLMSDRLMCATCVEALEFGGANPKGK